MNRTSAFALALVVLSQAAGCIWLTDGDGDDPPLVRTGALHASWIVTLDDAVVGSCAQVGAAKVEILSTSDGTGARIADRFPCDDRQGTTGPLAVGSHTVVLSILDGADVPLVSFPAQTGVLVTEGGVTDLGTFAFAFETPGAVTMNVYVDYGDAGGMNCADPVAGGSGVVRQEIDLYDAGAATCLDLPIGGTDQTGQPIGGDTCGSAMTCMENTVAQIVQLPGGDYEIAVRGYKAQGGNDILCYQIGVPIPFTISVDSDVDVSVPFDPAPADEAACNATKPDR